MSSDIEYPVLPLTNFKLIPSESCATCFYSTRSYWTQIARAGGVDCQLHHITIYGNKCTIMKCESDWKAKGAGSDE